MLTLTANPLAEALMPRARLLVLATLIMDEGNKWHLRALARQTGLSAPAVQAEANSLAKAGILTRESSGNRVYYSANPRCPIYTDLRNIIVKTVGIAGPVRDALKPFSRKIRLAYIYGSFAADTARHDSDVDVMIVGSVDVQKVYAVVEECGRALGRDVHAAIFPPDEYAAKLKLGRGFVHKSHTGPRIMLIGDENES
jgi:predicted nucleotidyltransferase